LNLKYTVQNLNFQIICTRFELQEINVNSRSTVIYEINLFESSLLEKIMYQSDNQLINIGFYGDQVGQQNETDKALIYNNIEVLLFIMAGTWLAQILHFTAFYCF